jgi:hypothetical protein
MSLIRRAWFAVAVARKKINLDHARMEFRDLRARAQQELGPKFDILTFHDEMLDGGTLPLDRLDARRIIGSRSKERNELAGISEAALGSEKKDS